MLNLCAPSTHSSTKNSHFDCPSYLLTASLQLYAYCAEHGWHVQQLQDYRLSVRTMKPVIPVLQHFCSALPYAQWPTHNSDVMTGLHYDSRTEKYMLGLNARKNIQLGTSETWLKLSQDAFYDPVTQKVCPACISLLSYATDGLLDRTC